MKICNPFHKITIKIYKLPSSDVELVTYRLTATAKVPHPKIKSLKNNKVTDTPAITSERSVHFGEYGKHLSSIYDRYKLIVDKIYNGPAIVEEPTSTTAILPSQKFYVDSFGFLHIEKV